VSFVFIPWKLENIILLMILGTRFLLVEIVMMFGAEISAAVEGAYKI